MNPTGKLNFNTTEIQSTTRKSEPTEAPLFREELLNSWRPEHGELPNDWKIQHFVAEGDNWLVALSDGVVVRWSAASATSEVIRLKPSKYATSLRISIHKVFLDPSGEHGLISCSVGQEAELFYLASSSSNPRSVRDVPALVESVGWDPIPGKSSLKANALLGTANGRIYTFSVRSAKDFTSLKVFDMPAGPSPVPVTGLMMEPLPSTARHGIRWYIMVVTSHPTRYYEYSGGPTVADVFAHADAHSFAEPGAGDSTFAILRLYHRSRQDLSIRALTSSRPFTERDIRADVIRAENHILPESFCLSTGVGLLKGDFMFGGDEPRESYVTAKTMLNFSRDLDQDNGDLDTTFATQAEVFHEADSDSDEDFGGRNVSRSGAGYSRHASNVRQKQSGFVHQEQSEDNIPMSIAVTDNHYLLLYHDKIVAVNRFTRVADYEYVAPQRSRTRGRLRALVVDQNYGKQVRIFFYTDAAIFQLHIDNEGRDLWRYLLNKATHTPNAPYLFDLAVNEAKHESQRNEIRILQADHCVAEHQLEKAATLYSKTSRPFEEICLLFIEAQESNALIQYVLERLSLLGNEHKTQQTMLATWLTELYLEKLSAATAELDFAGETYQPARTRTEDARGVLAEKRQRYRRRRHHTDDSDGDSIDKSEDEEKPSHPVYIGSERKTQETAQQAIQRKKATAERQTQAITEFKRFLELYHRVLDQKTTLKLMASYGRTDMLLFYADLCDDLACVVRHHMQSGSYLEAIETLRKAKEEQARPLFYEFSPTLMLKEPKKTVQAWIECPDLKPTLLLPAMYKYSEARVAALRAIEVQQEYKRAHPDDANVDNTKPVTKQVFGRDFISPDVWEKKDQAIVFLNFCVNQKRNMDRPLHNLLLLLYARNADEGPLLKFVKHELSTTSTCIDLKYALRVCRAEKKHETCVELYSAMGMYHQAMKLALTVDIELAKTQAKLFYSSDNDPVQKHLWMMVALYLIREKNDIKGAIALTKETPVLSIEDLLPHLPDTTTIDDFKDEIIGALQKCNTRIKKLRDEMKTISKDTRRIRGDIRSLRNRYGFVRAGQRCSLSGLPILGGPFYLFPTGNAYREEALNAFMVNWLSESQQKKLTSLREQLTRKQAEVRSLEFKLADSRRFAQKHGFGGKHIEREETQAVDAARGAISGLQDEIDAIIAGDDPLCGEPMITSIAKPFGEAPGEADILEDDWTFE